jgi:hypothetical protein
MSKLTRVLVLAAMLAAMMLAGGTAVAREQTAADATLRRVLAQEHSYNFGQMPAEMTSPARPAEPRGPSVRLGVALGVLAVALALVATLAVLTFRRASRRVRARQAT